MIKTRTVFMGSPDFAAAILQALIGNINLVGVVTQPDRPAGRGKVLSTPPVKILAQQAGIPVMQPERLRATESFSQLEAWKPEMIIVAAFGQILRQNVLDLPKYGCVNVHASLLPRWRGAAPIQAALLHGDAETGVTIMKMDAGIDTGGMYAQQIVPIYGEDDSATLSIRLAQAGAELLIESLPGIIAGDIKPLAQNEVLATYAPMIKKEEGELDFHHSAETLERKVRAFFPWPGTFFTWNGQVLKVLSAQTIEGSYLRPGQRGIIDGYPAVGTASGNLLLCTVKPAGKKAMAGNIFLNGARNWLEYSTDNG